MDYENISFCHTAMFYLCRSVKDSLEPHHGVVVLVENDDGVPAVLDDQVDESPAQRLHVGVQVDGVVLAVLNAQDPGRGVVVPAGVDERDLHRVGDGADVVGRGVALGAEDGGHPAPQQTAGLFLGLVAGKKEKIEKEACY